MRPSHLHSQQPRDQRGRQRASLAVQALGEVRGRHRFLSLARVVVAAPWIATLGLSNKR